MKKIFLILIIILLGCVSINKGSIPESSVLIPVGRLNKQGNKVQLFVDDNEVKPQFITDAHDGEWVVFGRNLLTDESRITIKVLRSSLDNTYKAKLSDYFKYKASETYIDKDHQDIIHMAQSLTGGVKGTDARVEVIVNYLRTQVDYSQPFKGMHYDYASETLEKGYGICVNYSKLFVALCRAINIPSRTISGTVVRKGSDYHHEWVEYINDEGFWQPVEPIRGHQIALDDPMYLDIIYSIENNIFFPHDEAWGLQSYSINNSKVLFLRDFKTHHNTGEFGYNLDRASKNLEFVIEYSAYSNLW